MRELVVYYSMSGNTKDTAEKIAAIRGADLLRIEPVKAYPDKGFIKFVWGGKSAVMAEKPRLKEYSFDAGSYDRVIVGFPVWAYTVAPPIRTFLTENREALKDKNVAVFACQGGSGAEKAFGKIADILGREGFDAELILNDPLENRSELNEGKIKEFCSRLG